MLLLLLATAAAAPPIGNLEVYTSFPTDVGLRGTIEGPGRLRLTGSAGVLPDAYLDTINNTALANGWYKQKTVDLLDAALEHALVLRLHAGWRPFPAHGFQFEAGYGFIGLGGGLTGAELFEVEYGYDLSALLGDELSFAARAAMHRVDASFGWEYVIRRHLLIRWDLGASYTAHATADIHREFEAYWPLSTELDRIEGDAEDDVIEALEKHVHTPIMAVGVGWRFQ